MWWIGVAVAEERVLVDGPAADAAGVDAVVRATGNPPWQVQPVRAADLRGLVVDGVRVTGCPRPTTNSAVLDRFKTAIEHDSAGESALALPYLTEAAAMVDCLGEPVERSLAVAVYSRLARTQVDLGDAAAATRAWGDALRFDPALAWEPAWDPRYRPAYDAARTPIGSGRLSVVPATAEVWIDGRPVRGTVDLPAGSHLLQSAPPEVRSTRVTLAPGGALSVLVAGAELGPLDATGRAALTPLLTAESVGYAWTGGTLYRVGAPWEPLSLPADPSRRRALAAGLRGAGVAAIVGGAAAVTLGGWGMAAHQSMDQDDGTVLDQEDRVAAFYVAQGEAVLGGVLLGVGLTSGSVSFLVQPRRAGAGQE